MIQPYRETAWRYWSDVLTKNQLPEEALDKAIEAAVSEPFNRVSRQALTQWAQSTKTPMGLAKVDFSSANAALMQTLAGMAYDSVRRAWKGSDGKLTSLFSTQYPKDTIYRHSITEETQALQAALRAAAGDSVFANLQRIEDAHVLEGFIFFARADAGIARDYADYVRANRTQLKRFWSQFVIGAKYIK